MLADHPADGREPQVESRMVT